ATHVDRAAIPGTDLCEAPLLRAEVRVIVDRRVHAQLIAGEILLEHRDDAIGVSIWQPAHQRTIDDAEHRRRQSTAEREGANGDDAEAEVLAQGAAAEANVTGNGRHYASREKEGEAGSAVRFEAA